MIILIMSHCKNASQFRVVRKDSNGCITPVKEQLEVDGKTVRACLSLNMHIRAHRRTVYRMHGGIKIKDAELVISTSACSQCCDISEDENVLL